MRSTVLLTASVGLAVLLAGTILALTAAPGAGQTTTVTLVGAGDIASCDYTRDSATARLLGKTTGTVYTLGDNVYPNGTLKHFRNCYRPTWGTYKARTKPSVGNHEYETPSGSASGYFDYFGAQAGSPSRGYYSYNRGRWHIVVLNSECREVGGCDRRSPQGRWLRNDLDNHPAKCTLAYFHHPLFASTGADTTVVRPFWKILYSHNADVILGGHVHYYERFARQNPYGDRDTSRGIRQFVVGTGGKPPLQPMSSPRAANSQVDSEKSPGKTAYGVLKLRLSAGSYAWKFLPVAGENFTDSGTGQCH